MANKDLFSTVLDQADAVNAAGGKAYAKSNKAALASYALVGTFNDTFYSSAKFSLETVLKLLKGQDDLYVAQLAIYSRRKAYMKDMPSFLVAWLGANKSPYFKQAFVKVIDNGRMLRNFVQYIRSGVLGRKSFGSTMKKAIQNWFESRNTNQLMKALPGNDPTLADIIKMAHPSGQHNAFYAWVLDNDVKKRKDGHYVKTRDGWRKLPALVCEFESFKSSLNAGRRTQKTPDVPFQLLTGLSLKSAHWNSIAEKAGWQMTRMNLNTFDRHGVFDNKKTLDLVVNKLSSKELVKKAGQFPYQIYTAYQNCNSNEEVKNALQDALDNSLDNVPSLSGKTYVFVDVSGSMEQPVMGSKGQTTCVQAASVLASALFRKNPNNVKLIPVDTKVYSEAKFNPRDSIITNAEKLSKFGGYGTNLGAAMQWLNNQKKDADLVIFISDNESWMDCHWGTKNSTVVQQGFKKLNKRCPNAKLVNIDIQASLTNQAKTHKNTMNFAGFSDNVFKVIEAFRNGELGGDHMVKEIMQQDV